MQISSRPRLRLCATLTVLWAGVSLGGNIIAAPAKFQVDALSTLDLLQVGRAQFAWTGIAEAAICAVLVGTFAVARTRPAWPIVVAVLLFALQQSWLQPALQVRTDLRLTGAPVGASHLHLIFVALELLKCSMLAWGGHRTAARIT